MHHKITINQAHCPLPGSVYSCWSVLERLPGFFLIKRIRRKNYTPVAMYFMSNTPTAFMIKQTISLLSNYMLMSCYLGIVNLIHRGVGKFLSDYSSLSDLKFLRVRIFKQGGSL